MSRLAGRARPQKESAADRQQKCQRDDQGAARIVSHEFTIAAHAEESPDNLDYRLSCLTPGYERGRYAWASSNQPAGSPCGYLLPECGEMASGKARYDSLHCVSTVAGMKRLYRE